MVNFLLLGWVASISFLTSPVTVVRADALNPNYDFDQATSHDANGAIKNLVDDCTSFELNRVIDEKASNLPLSPLATLVADCAACCKAHGERAKGKDSCVSLCTDNLPRAYPHEAQGYLPKIDPSKFTAPADFTQQFCRATGAQSRCCESAARIKLQGVDPNSVRSAAKSVWDVACDKVVIRANGCTLAGGRGRGDSFRCLVMPKGIGGCVQSGLGGHSRCCPKDVRGADFESASTTWSKSCRDGSLATLHGGGHGHPYNVGNCALPAGAGNLWECRSIVSATDAANRSSAQLNHSVEGAQNPTSSIKKGADPAPLGEPADEPAGRPASSGQ